MRRVFVDPEAPQRDALQEAVKWIRNGGLVALPTDTLYGLAADPFRAGKISASSPAPVSSRTISARTA